MSKSTSLTDSDLEYLNALADGELSAENARIWKARLETDPAAAETYENILNVKRGLGSLAAESLAGNADARPSQTYRSAFAKWPLQLIAASLAAALLLGGALLFLNGREPPEPEGILAWHEELSGKEYIVEENNGPLFVSLNQATDIPVPDLRASKLYLVETRVLAHRQRAILHYRGLRGCRLTIWYGRKTPEASGPDTEAAPPNLRRWSVGVMDFQIIATGMDRARFRSIADYVEFIVRQSGSDDRETRTAMSRAYRDAGSCV